MSTLVPTASKNTEAFCWVSGDSAKIYSAWSQFCWTAILISTFFFFKWKAAQARCGKPYGCWSSASSQDCLIHEPSTVSVRFFRHSASNFLTLVLTARLVFSLSPGGLSPLSFSIKILVKCRRLAKISTCNRNQEIFTRPGYCAARNALGVIHIDMVWLAIHALAGWRIQFENACVRINSARFHILPKFFL